MLVSIKENPVYYFRLKEEMRTLRDQVQENKDLNKTLKLELSVYEKLENTENQGEMFQTNLLFSPVFCIFRYGS